MLSSAFVCACSMMPLFTAAARISFRPGHTLGDSSLLCPFGLPDGPLVVALGRPFLPAPHRRRLPPSVPVARAVRPRQVWTEEVYRDRDDDGGVVLRGDLAQGLEQPELQRRRALEDVGGLPQTLGGLVLALGGDDLGAPLALALGLPRHRPLHLLRNLDVLDLDDADLDPPGVGLLVYYRLQLLVYLLAVNEQVVEVLLAQDAPERRLGDLARREHVVLDLDHGFVGIDDPEVDDGVDAGRHVVAGDDVLGRHVHGDGAQVHLDHLVAYGDEEEQPRPLGALDPAQGEYDAPLVLVDYAHRAADQEQKHHDGDDGDDRDAETGHLQ